MKQKEAKNLLIRIVERSLRKSRTCLFPGCHERSVFSHLLQKRGVLERITENNHLFVYTTNHHIPESKLKLTGRNDAFTFQGYCQKHDSQLFKIIEQGEINFDDDKQCLLFTFRAIFNELRKKEIFNEAFSNAIKSHNLDGVIDKGQLREYVQHNSLGERDLRIHLQTVHKDYIEGTESFKFRSFRISKIPICISAVISVETDFEMISQALLNPKKWSEKQLSALVINFFPQAKDSIMLLGYPKDQAYMVEDFITKNILPIAEDSSLKMLSDLIIKYTETWACSPKFYSQYLRQNEKMIYHYSSETTFHNWTLNVPFNMFAEYLK